MSRSDNPEITLTNVEMPSANDKKKDLIDIDDFILGGGSSTVAPAPANTSSPNKQNVLNEFQILNSVFGSTNNQPLA